MKTMKKIVAIVAVALMLVSILPLSVFAADNVADLDTLAINTSYTTRTTTAKWVATNAATAKSAMTSQNVSVILNGKKTAKGTLTSPTLSDGISELSFGYGYSYSESKGVNATINIKDTAGNIVATDNLVVSSITQNTAYSYNWTLPTAVTGDFVIEILNNGPSNSTSNKDRLSIWNVTWVSAASESEVPSTCEHNYVTEQTKAPTCTTAGENTLTCSKCTDVKTETVNALGHTYGEPVETVAPDCVNAGEQESTCSACGDVKTETVKALGHNYVDGACDVCGEAQPLEATITFDNLNKMISSSSTQQVWKENGIVVTYDKNTYNSNLAEYANPIRFYAGTKITISYPGITKVEIVANNTTYASAVKNALSGSTVNGTIVTYECEAIDSVSFVLTAQARVNSITVYGSAPSDCEHDYVGVETQAPTCSAEGVMTYTCSKCQESYTEAIAVIAHNYVEDIIDATCTTTGTATYECSVCFDSYDEVIPVKAHNYVDDVCADCGHVKAYKGTIDFSNAEQRTELTTQIQIWTNEGLTFTNNKLTGNNIADYTDPIRIYKNSGIVIEFPEMSKLIIDASGVGNDYLWDATLTDAGLSFTVENKIYTITFAEAVNSLELTCANQVRANSITAIVAHECTYDSVVTDPTCVSGGYTTNTCTKCGDSNVSDATEALGHTYAHEFDVDCDVCGAERAVVAPVIDVKLSISEDVNGLAFRFEADVAGFAIKAGTFVQADYTNATYKGYKLIETGVTATNGVTSTTIKGERMCDLDENGKAMFAYRIIDIPADKLDVEITMTPYYVVEIDGEVTTVYGDAVVGSYAEIAG